MVTSKFPGSADRRCICGELNESIRLGLSASPRAHRPALLPLALLLGVLLVIFTAVASGTPQSAPAESKGDNGLAIDAEINGPRQISVDEKGNIYIYQSARVYRGIQILRIERGAIRKIDSSTHKITTLAVGCEPRLHAPPLPGLCFGFLTHLSASSHRLLLSDLDFDKVWALDVGSLRLSLIAGNGDRGLAGDGESGGNGKSSVQTGIGAPMGLAVDDDGNVLVCSSHRVRRVDAKTGIISTVAGTGRPGLAGDGGPAVKAELTSPTGVAVDRIGNLYIADAASFRIRRVNAATGIIETIAGDGQRGFKGEGGLAKAASLNVVGDVALDSDGNVFFTTGWRICRVDRLTGVISTLAGTGEAGISGDGGLATLASIEPYAFAVDKDGNLFIAEYENNRIRRVDSKTGIITTVGGNGLPHRQPAPGG